MGIFQSARGLLNVCAAVDIGSARTRILAEGRGVVLNERSYLAMSTRTGEVAGAGDEAYKLYGRSPAHIDIRRPVRQGVIEDFDSADMMLRAFFNKAFPRKPLFGAYVVVVAPTGVTDVEKKAFEDVCVQAGAREVRHVETAVASALGMGLPILNTRGLVVINLGGGTTQFALISDGEILHSGCERVGGDDLNDAISAGIKKKYGVILGHRTLENLKLEVGNVYPLDQEETREVHGKDAIGGLPRAVFVASYEMREMMAAPLERIVNSIKNLLEKAPPDLSEHIYRNGMYLCGGNSMIKGMGQLIERITGITCKVSRRGALAPIQGVEKIFSEPAKHKRYLALSAVKRFTG